MDYLAGITVNTLDRDIVAKAITDKYVSWQADRQTFLKEAQDIRDYLFSTTALNGPSSNQKHVHKNHVPQLAQIYESLNTQHWNILFANPKFFDFIPERFADRDIAANIVELLLSKLERKNFRETTGRSLVSFFNMVGPAIARVTTEIEYDEDGSIAYKGFVVKNVDYKNIVFDPTAEDFYCTAKVIRSVAHMSDIIQAAKKDENGIYNQEAIKYLKEARSASPKGMSDYVKQLTKTGIMYDGFNTTEDYLNSGKVEILEYIGDLYNSATGEVQTRRIIKIVDRLHVLSNVANDAPAGFDGLHMAGWRPRPNNLWPQGPLHQLVGMQYHIDHLENSKADIWDLIKMPTEIHKGEVRKSADASQPRMQVFVESGADNGYAVVHPDVTILNTDTMLAFYMRKMEDYAGALPQQQGIRTPGEKTLGEVSILETNAQKMAGDKAKLLEAMIAKILQEAYLRMVGPGYDDIDTIELLDDITGQMKVKELSLKDLKIRGGFRAIGVSRWERKNEALRNLTQAAPFLQNPAVAPHVSGVKLAEYVEEILDLREVNIVEAFIGVKEAVQAQYMQQAEDAKLKQDIEQFGDPSALPQTPASNPEVGMTQQAARTPNG